MQQFSAEKRAGPDGALAALRARLEKARQGADRAMAGRSAGPDADAVRQVYASHIAWLQDRICEMERNKGELSAPGIAGNSKSPSR